jgi:O-antigen/teichoic acid export membrane protein
MLTMMVASAFDAAFRPRIAAALAVGRREELAREYRNVSRAVLLLCLPALVMLVGFPGRVMPALGGQFAASGTVAAIVAAGTLVSYLVGPAASALTMAGRSRVPLVNGIVGGSVGVVVGFTLVPSLGPVGVALGQFVSMVTWNTLHAIAAWRVLGVVGIGRAHARLVAAALVAALAGAAANALAPADKYLAFAAVGAAVLGAYAATLAVVGIDTDDWEMIRGVIRLLGRQR